MHPEPVRVQKAFAYITRRDDLLVMRHRDVPLSESGVQVPAGTVRPGEELEAAAAREALEETGLENLRVQGYLGSSDYDVRPGRSEVQERHFFHLLAPDQVPDEWLWHEMHDGTQAPTAFLYWWLPLRKAHVLAAGMGALLNRIVVP